MKRTLFILAFAIGLLSCHKSILNDIDDLKGKYNDLDGRVVILENLCREMNTNIASLQALVGVLESHDYITSITAIKRNGVEIGYVITFGNHEPITIYHGNDGQSGTDANPVVGVTRDVEGHFVWTINGEIMTDGNGEQIMVYGLNGTDGQNGNTPKLRIDNDFWYVSYDDGVTWTQLGKAVGNDGDNGRDGVDGDSMFQSVTQDDTNVYFTLTNGTVITIAKRVDNGGTLEQPEVEIIDGAIMAPFSVSPTKQVYFSRGNLLYKPSTETWSFADTQTHRTEVEPQVDFYNSVNGADTTRIDVFLYASSGYSNSKPQSYVGSTGATRIKQSYSYNADIANSNYDWGQYNAISNGGNVAGIWRTLTVDEWNYLLFIRKNAEWLHSLGIVNGVRGLILLPDDWNNLHYPFIPSTEHFNEGYNMYSYSRWIYLEKHGAVFLPGTFFEIDRQGHYSFWDLRWSVDMTVAKCYSSSDSTQDTNRGLYWTSSYSSTSTQPLRLFFAEGQIVANYYETSPFSIPTRFCHVRLVKDVQ